MVPSATLTREDVQSVPQEMYSSAPSLSYESRVPAEPDRSRAQLLRYAHSQLVSLAKRQSASNEGPYTIVLRLLGYLLRDGSPTPQIGDNGEGGVSVHWLVDGCSLVIDYEDETEILVTAEVDGRRLMCENLTAWWVPSDETLVAVRGFLSDLAERVRNPVPLH